MNYSLVIEPFDVWGFDYMGLLRLELALVFPEEERVMQQV